MAMTANGPEPNIDLTLGEMTYSLRPTFGALMRIEQALGAGIGALRLRFLRSEYGVGEVTRIVYEGIRAVLGNDAPKIEEIGEAIIRHGLDNEAGAAALEMIEAALAGFERFAEGRARSEAEDGPPGGGEGAEAGEDAAEDPSQPQAEDSPGAASTGQQS